MDANHLHSVIRNLGEGVYALDADGRLTFLNRAAETMLGWKQEELLGREMHDAIHFRRADGTHVPAEECPLLDVISSGKTVRVREDVFVRKDGTLLEVAYTSSPLYVQGRIEGAVLGFSDMREQRRLERERDAALQQLQGALDELRRSHWLIRRFQEFLPVCACCHRVRDPEAQWEPLVEFLASQGLEMTHGLCPACADRSLREARGTAGPP
jgi:PAS domain S-box-containing protein